jgi:outer membrane protein TolC
MALADAVGSALQFQPQLIIAQQDLIEARSDTRVATAAFLPSAQAQFTDERYVPANGGGPVVVVGNTVLGGAQTQSAYGSLSLSWNLMNSGRDLAAYRGAQAGARAASHGVDSQLADTAIQVLQAYADVYEADIAARSQSNSVVLLKSIHARAQERYQNGHGTTIAIGQARVAALDAEQTLNRACRAAVEKSAALANSMGAKLETLDILTVSEVLPLPVLDGDWAALADAAVDTAPSVLAAKERVAAAQAKLEQSERAFGPSLSLSAQRDYLGQDPRSFGVANRHVAANDYRIGLTFQQPLFPFVSEAAAVSRARAEVRKAQASYEQSRLDAQANVQKALGSRREAETSYIASKASLADAENVLRLTQSLYRAGRADLDSVQHAQMDRDKARADVLELESRKALAQWAFVRALRPGEFSGGLVRQLRLEPLMAR